MTFRKMTGTAGPKPAKGAFRRERRVKKVRADLLELLAKKQARTRDSNRCRWPHGSKGACQHIRLEAAHYVAKSLLGGNRRENLITLDADTHQGPFSLHSGDLRIVPLTPQLMDGLVAFEARIGGRWQRLHEERSIGDGRNA